jgi:hypothetical protein
VGRIPRSSVRCALEAARVGHTAYLPSSAAEQEPAEDRTASCHNPVDQFDRPNQRTSPRQSGDAGVATYFLKHEKDGTSRGKLITICRDDLHRAAGVRPKLGCQRRTWALLKRHYTELVFVVMPLEPSDSPPTEVSPAVPNEPMLNQERPHFLASVHRNDVLFHIEQSQQISEEHLTGAHRRGGNTGSFA